MTEQKEPEYIITESQIMSGNLDEIDLRKRPLPSAQDTTGQCDKIGCSNFPYCINYVPPCVQDATEKVLDAIIQWHNEQSKQFIDARGKEGHDDLCMCCASTMHEFSADFVESLRKKEEL